MKQILRNANNLQFTESMNLTYNEAYPLVYNYDTNRNT